MEESLGKQRTALVSIPATTALVRLKLVTGFVTVANHAPPGEDDAKYGSCSSIADHLGDERTDHRTQITP